MKLTPGHAFQSNPQYKKNLEEREYCTFVNAAEHTTFNRPIRINFYFTSVENPMGIVQLQGRAQSRFAKYEICTRSRRQKGNRP